MPKPTPICIGCGRTPEEIGYHYYHEGTMTDSEYVRREDGTYNPENGHFACDLCYIAIGCPTAPNGWKAP